MRSVHQGPVTTLRSIAHQQAAELIAISDLLDTLPQLPQLIAHDLFARGQAPTKGRRGMSAERLLRVVILKQLRGLTFDDLSFQLADSFSARIFCRFATQEKAPARSTLQENLALIRPETMSLIQDALLRSPQARAIESGAKLRMDCTIVDTCIHKPTDNHLLWDVVRVVTRTFKRACEGQIASFRDRTRTAKRCHVQIQRTSKSAKRVALYARLIAVAQACLRDAHILNRRLARCEHAQPSWLEMLDLCEQIIDQARRRVLQGEAVPGAEKIVSLFETHTDVIVPKRGVTRFGHKVCLNVGASSLITDCLVLRGNPGDSTLFKGMLERHHELFARPPREVAADGAFSSQANLETARKIGVKQVMFSRHQGIKREELTSSPRTFKRLRRFRAGIEGVISWLKRSFGLRRCPWRGWEHFQVFIQAAVLTANLLTLARHQLASTT